MKKNDKTNYIMSERDIKLILKLANKSLKDFTELSELYFSYYEHLYK